MTVLRASSLAAVTILVWSTSPKPRAMAHSRAIWRTRTISSSLRSGTSSSLTTAIAALARLAGHVQEVHSELDVERGAHAGQGEAELDEGDGDRGPHSRHHGVGVEDASHGRDVGQHAADERVHEVEGGD